MQYAVIKTIKVRGKTQHIARALVDGVPDKTPADDVYELLEKAGWSAEFSDGGVAWGNHDVKPSSRVSGIVETSGDVPTWTWEGLQQEVTTPRTVQTNVRLPVTVKTRVKQAAAQRGVDFTTALTAALAYWLDNGAPILGKDE